MPRERNMNVCLVRALVACGGCAVLIGNGKQAPPNAQLHTQSFGDGAHADGSPLPAPRSHDAITGRPKPPEPRRSQAAAPAPADRDVDMPPPHLLGPIRLQRGREQAKSCSPRR
eukprot:scaffold292645_cov38-Tisochrysis_lutea.AAC.1